MDDHTIKIIEKEDPPRIKEEYSTLTIRIRPHDPNVKMSEQVKKGASLKFAKPLVEAIEGPFDEKGELVKELLIGKTYVYKATKFKESTYTPIKHIWFAEQIDDGEIVDLEYCKGENPYLDDKGIVCFKYAVKECKKVRIYAYVWKPDTKVSIETNVNPCHSRMYFVAGAGNDKDGWNYVNRFKKIFTEQRINGFFRIDASGGKAKDIAFTTAYRTFSSLGKSLTPNSNGKLEYKIKRRAHVQITKAVELIKSDLKKHSNDSNFQINLAGYSYGSVLLANVALVLSDEGITIDNLILIGSPISDKSELYNALNSNENICKVVRHDIKNDSLSNPQSTEEYFEGGLDNSSDDGHHFDLARPGEEADKKILNLALQLKKMGVK